jgi:Ca2+-binding RTX toxin-like protein
MSHNFVESMESRVLFASSAMVGTAVLEQSGVLKVEGTRRSDEIHLSLNVDVAKLDVTINGALVGQFDVAAVTAGLHVSGGNGNDVITVDAGVTLPATLLGGNGKDALSGGSGDDVLDGGNGNDILLGGLGGDTLRGGNGKDALDGGDGADSLQGGNGKDSVSGSLGSDSFDGDSASEILDKADDETLMSAKGGKNGKGKS